MAKCDSIFVLKIWKITLLVGTHLFFKVNIKKTEQKISC